MDSQAREREGIEREVGVQAHEAASAQTHGFEGHTPFPWEPQTDGRLLL